MTRSYAKKLVLDYLITTLDYIDANLPEELLEAPGGREIAPGVWAQRPKEDLVAIDEAIETLRSEFLRRTRNMG